MINQLEAENNTSANNSTFFGKGKISNLKPPNPPSAPPPSIGSLYSSDNFCFHLKNSFISEVFRCRFDWPRFRCARACVPLTRSSSFLSSKTFFGDLKDGARVATGGNKNYYQNCSNSKLFHCVDLWRQPTATQSSRIFRAFKNEILSVSLILSLFISLSLSLSTFRYFSTFFQKKKQTKKTNFLTKTQTRFYEF